MEGVGGDEREGGCASLCGVLEAGQRSAGGLWAPVSSTVSRLSCRERSAGVESSMELITESSVSVPWSEGGAGLWRVTPSSPLTASTRRLHDRPKYDRERTFPGRTMFPSGTRRNRRGGYSKRIGRESDEIKLVLVQELKMNRNTAAKETKEMFWKQVELNNTALCL